MRFLTVIFVTLFSFPALAQDVVGQVATVVKNAPAPFTGTLFDAAAIAKILAEKEFAKKQCELDSSLLLAKQQAKCDLDASNLKLERDILSQKYTAVVDIKDKELNRLYDGIAKAEKQSSYKWLWFAGGFVVGAAATIGIAYAVSNAR